MIESVIPDSFPVRYVYFSNEGTITKISSKPDNDTDESWAAFNIQDVIPFIDGTYRFSDYVVTKNTVGIGYSIVKKRVDVKSRSVETQIRKISACIDAEIMIVLKDNIIKIMASDSIKETVSDNQEVTIAGKASHPFFVTLKDRPDFIIQEVSVPYNILISGKEYAEQLCVIDTDVSVYTRPYFNSYSLET